MVLVSLLTLGCGGRPSAPTPTVASISIVGHEGLLFLGESYVFAMAARLSDGTTVTSGGTWGSDAPAVASIHAVAGIVQVGGLGEATLFVDYQGHRATRRIRSTVRYGGAFSATWRISSCEETGAWVGLGNCSDYAAGSTRRSTGSFTQLDDVVTAVMLAGGLPSEPVTARVTAAGDLRFRTEHRGEDENLVAEGDWMLKPAGLAMVEGTRATRWRVPGVSGHLQIRGALLPSTVGRTLEKTGDAEPSGTDVIRAPGT